MTSDEQFLRATVTQVPARQPVLDQHLEDEYDELNPHLLMGRIQEWAVDHESDEPAAAQRLRQLLEAGVTSGDELVQHLIVISFLEHLSHRRARLEPALGVSLGPGPRAARARELVTRLRESEPSGAP